MVNVNILTFLHRFLLPLCFLFFIRHLSLPPPPLPFPPPPPFFSISLPPNFYSFFLFLRGYASLFFLLMHLAIVSWCWYTTACWECSLTELSWLHISVPLNQVNCRCNPTPVDCKLADIRYLWCASILWYTLSRSWTGQRYSVEALIELCARSWVYGTILPPTPRGGDRRMEGGGRKRGGV